MFDYEYYYDSNDTEWPDYEDFLLNHFDKCEENINATLEIKPSRIYGAGNGVFAKRDIRAFEIIQRFYGEEAPSDQVRSYDEELYCFDTGVGYKIYPSPDCIVRYINDTVKLNSFNKKIGRHPIQHNTEFECWKVGPTEAYVFVYAIEDIPKGEELYIDYGNSYW